MKKIIYLILTLCLIGSTALFSEENSEVKFSTKIGLTFAYPLEGMLSVTENIKIPAMTSDNSLMKGNNILVKIGADFTPITVEGRVDFVWTPIAFIELFGGVKIGSGWNFEAMKVYALVKNINDANKNKKETHIFDKLYLKANMGGAFQFDTGALIEGDWSHVIFKIDQAVNYTMMNFDKGDSWSYQTASIPSRNGWNYYGSYIVGYQMPIPLQFVGLMLETEKRLYKTENFTQWGGDKMYLNLAPVLNFKILEWMDLTLSGQWHTKNNYVEGTDKEAFYTMKVLDKNKSTNFVFRRVALILSMTIPNN